MDEGGDLGAEGGIWGYEGGGRDTPPTPPGRERGLRGGLWAVCRRELDLKKPLYQRTAAYGHFGRDSFPWEVPKKLKY